MIVLIAVVDFATTVDSSPTKTLAKHRDNALAGESDVDYYARARDLEKEMTQQVLQQKKIVQRLDARVSSKGGNEAFRVLHRERKLLFSMQMRLLKARYEYQLILEE